MTDPRIALAERVASADGVSPLNEASRIAIAAGEVARVDEVVRDGDDVVGAAYAAGDSPVELYVDPARRRNGTGRALLEELLRRGERQFWAHGDLPAARSLARTAGLEPVRTLLVLERDATTPLPAERDVEGVTIRTWQDADAAGLVAVNARAFASHPEQGAMDDADLRARMGQSWFDPQGLFVAERAGEVVGFHWTKIDPPTADGGEVGEVYVVGVDPSEQGRGLGKALTLRGLHHLTSSGVRRIDLYVEGDNTPALATYRGLGFSEAARDVLYAV
ncbi:mycothiol synthase [Mumia zhuanghuii]|uniref:Mycothiol acetyltransferase n=2 Tax=Mumia TaxID=1546255 RepID=A0ABW1QJH2_9ACTN|nr:MULTISPECIES: mycothiol synthase [Mumia]KAA1425326.1 mycothiol synthase [Mumia zhuanghuii]